MLTFHFDRFFSFAWFLYFHYNIILNLAVNVCNFLNKQTIFSKITSCGYEVPQACNIKIFNLRGPWVASHLKVCLQLMS